MGLGVALVLFAPAHAAPVLSELRFWKEAVAAVARVGMASDRDYFHRDGFHLQNFRSAASLENFGTDLRSLFINHPFLSVHVSGGNHPIFSGMLQRK